MRKYYKVCKCKMCNELFVADVIYSDDKLFIPINFSTAHDFHNCEDGSLGFGELLGFQDIGEVEDKHGIYNFKNVEGI